MVVVLKRPRKPPPELGGISNPTGARKKARPLPCCGFFRVSMVKEKRVVKSAELEELHRGTCLGLAIESKIKIYLLKVKIKYNYLVKGELKPLYISFIIN